MDRGLFEGTFYVVQKPFYTNTIPLHLNDVQNVIYHNILSSEPITRLYHEFGAIGDGVIWHKDEFEIIPDALADEYQPLLDHSNIFLKKIVFTYFQTCINNINNNFLLYFTNYFS